MEHVEGASGGFVEAFGQLGKAMDYFGVTKVVSEYVGGAFEHAGEGFEHSVGAFGHSEEASGH